jgi:hypothetical protein
MSVNWFLVDIVNRNGAKAVFTIFTIYNQQMHNMFSTYWSLKTLLRVSVRSLSSSSSSSSSGISFYFAKVASRDSVVGIVTRIRTVRSRNDGSIPGKGQEIFLFSKTWSGAHPTSYTVGTGSSFSGVKWPRREICCTKVGNAWLCMYIDPPPPISPSVVQRHTFLQFDVRVSQISWKHERDGISIARTIICLDCNFTWREHSVLSL